MQKHTSITITFLIIYFLFFVTLHVNAMNLSCQKERELYAKKILINSLICSFNNQKNRLLVAKKIFNTSSFFLDMLSNAPKEKKISIETISYENFQKILPIMKCVAYNQISNIDDYCEKCDLTYLIDVLSLNSYCDIKSAEDILIQNTAKKIDQFETQKEKKEALQKIKRNIKQAVIYEKIFSAVKKTLLPSIKEIPNPLHPKIVEDKNLLNGIIKIMAVIYDKIFSAVGGLLPVIKEIQKSPHPKIVEDKNLLDGIIKITATRERDYDYNCSITLCFNNCIIYQGKERAIKNLEQAIAIDPQKKYVLVPQSIIFGDDKINGLLIDLANPKEYFTIENILFLNYSKWNKKCGIFNADGTRLVVCEPFGTYRLIDTATRAIIQQISTQQSDDTLNAFFNPEGTLLVIPNNNNNNAYLILCSTTGKLKKEILINDNGTQQFWNSKRFFYNQNTFLITNKSLVVVFIYMDTFIAHKFEYVSLYTFNTAKNMLMFVDNSNKIIFYNVKNNHHTQVKFNKNYIIENLKFDHDCNNLLIKAMQKETKDDDFSLYNQKENKFHYLYCERKNNDFDWSPCDNYIIYDRLSGWDINKYREFTNIFEIKLFDIHKHITIDLAENAYSVNHVFYKNHLIYISLRNSRVLIYNINTREKIGVYAMKEISNSFTTVACETSDDGELLLVPGKNQISLVHIKTNTIIKSWEKGNKLAFIKHPIEYLCNYSTKQGLQIEYNIEADDSEEEVKYALYSLPKEEVKCKYYSSPDDINLNDLDEYELYQLRKMIQKKM